MVRRGILPWVAFTICLTFAVLFLELKWLSIINNEKESILSPVLLDAKTTEGSNLPNFDISLLNFEISQINHSVHNELLILDKRHRYLLDKVAQLQLQLDQVRNSLYEDSRRLMRLRANIDEYTLKYRDVTSHSVVYLENWPMMNRINVLKQSEGSVFSSSVYNIESGIDWSRCPLGSFLHFCFDTFSSEAKSVHTQVFSLLSKTPHFVPSCSPQSGACVQIAIGYHDVLQCFNSSSSDSLRAVEKPTCLGLLPTLSDSVQFFRALQSSSQRSTFAIASPFFPPDGFRPSYDFLIPVQFLTVFPPSNYTSVSLLPGRRPILLGFSGGRLHSVASLTQYDAIVLESLQHLSRDQPVDSIANSDQQGREIPETDPTSRVSLHFGESESQLANCWRQDTFKPALLHTFDKGSAIFDWFPCEDSIQLLRDSTFGLVLGSSPRSSDSSSVGRQAQLLTALAAGAVPVVLGELHFPLDEAISPDQWSRSVLRLPRPRALELPSVLMSIPEAHIIELRRQGQLLFRRHFADYTSQYTSLLLAFSRRLGMPQPPIPTWPSRPAFSAEDSRSALSPAHRYTVSPKLAVQMEPDEVLGPVGPEQASPTFPANFTGRSGSARLGLVGSGQEVSPFWLFPTTPWDQVALPPEAAFSAASHVKRNLRPINHTINLAGFEFNLQLGGMHPYEQFTVVMLTYSRFRIACRTLEALLNLPYLHSVVVVWNHPVRPSPLLSWPDLHVPLRVVHSLNNSLNNRFLPYDLIQTDAVLSIDDDIQLRHDEIILGFRVWRENRDRLVGYPVRSHFWNSSSQQWYYHYDYTCEFSLILTGAAFFHRYFLFAYTWEMPLAVRSMVDELMNCEDIAMNFLVAHLTRKPPIKVTGRWSFNCPDCDQGLHLKPNHYVDRSKCLNRLARLYGYTPLVYSQYRLDSLLFKTHIPANKLKCFKFI